MAKRVDRDAGRDERELGRSESAEQGPLVYEAVEDHRVEEEGDNRLEQPAEDARGRGRLRPTLLDMAGGLRRHSG